MRHLKGPWPRSWHSPASFTSITSARAHAHRRPPPCAAARAFVGDVEVGLRGAEVAELHAGQVRHAQAVLEAVVRGAGEHVVRTAQLLQLAQPLELRRVDERHQVGLHLRRRARVRRVCARLCERNERGRARALAWM